MRSLLALVVLFSATSAFARQYIQCSTMDYNYSDVIVVNLQTTEGGTLFISSGMQNPDEERLLMNIKKDTVTAGKVSYKIVSDGYQGEVVLNSADIGKSSDYLVADVRINTYAGKFSCFARIYND